MSTESNKLNLKERVYVFLKHHYDQGNYDARFTGLEIATWYYDNHKEAIRQKQENSKATKHPVDTQEGMILQISRQISAIASRGDFENDSKIENTEQSKIKITGGYPRKYYYTEASDATEIQQAESVVEIKTGQKKLLEKDLYPILGEYLFYETPRVYIKYIDDKKSSHTQGTNGNEWLHPDMVGLEVLSNDWIPEIKWCARAFSGKKTKLWSFEVKLIINRSNLRASFSQAVTNSSWANFGYLVAGEINKNAMDELRILCNLHGIGFIELNVNIPTESQILIPAKERVEIDWNTANRLADQNPHFKKYIENINLFYGEQEHWNPEYWGGELS